MGTVSFQVFKTVAANFHTGVCATAFTETAIKKNENYFFIIKFSKKFFEPNYISFIIFIGVALFNVLSLLGFNCVCKNAVRCGGLPKCRSSELCKHLFIFSTYRPYGTLKNNQ